MPFTVIEGAATRGSSETTLIRTSEFVTGWSKLIVSSGAIWSVIVTGTRLVLRPARSVTDPGSIIRTTGLTVGYDSTVRNTSLGSVVYVCTESAGAPLIRNPAAIIDGTEIFSEKVT